MLLTTAACKRKQKARVETVEESGPTIASTVNTGDPKSSIQLVKGFYDIEQNAWRWTMGKFMVTLRPPITASKNGANLVVKFAIPDLVMDKLKSMTLSASVNGTPIPGETYTKAGDQVYTKPVPASAFGPDAVNVDFALDKFLPPGAQEQRELGIVVSSIGLEPK